MDKAEELNKIKNRVIFVGLHNKPDMTPLDSRTKTGKLIDKVIAELPKDLEIIKSNIINLDYYPSTLIVSAEANTWYWIHLPDFGDIVVLLGHATRWAHENISHRETWATIKAAHPASIRSHKDMDKYIKDISTKIKEQL